MKVKHLAKFLLEQDQEGEVQVCHKYEYLPIRFADVHENGDIDLMCHSPSDFDKAFPMYREIPQDD